LRVKVQKRPSIKPSEGCKCRYSESERHGNAAFGERGDGFIPYRLWSRRDGRKLLPSCTCVERFLHLRGDRPMCFVWPSLHTLSLCPPRLALISRLHPPAHPILPNTHIRTHLCARHGQGGVVDVWVSKSRPCHGLPKAGAAPCQRSKSSRYSARTNTPGPHHSCALPVRTPSVCILSLCIHAGFPFTPIRHVYSFLASARGCTWLARLARRARGSPLPDHALCQHQHTTFDLGTVGLGQPSFLSGLQIPGRT
jgi:hypothetical protein